MFIGLAMAEVVSGLPSSGGPFFWASLLGGQHSGVLSWVTGVPAPHCTPRLEVWLLTAWRLSNAAALSLQVSVAGKFAIGIVCEFPLLCNLSADLCSTVSGASPRQWLGRKHSPTCFDNHS